MPVLHDHGQPPLYRVGPLTGETAKIGSDEKYHEVAVNFGEVAPAVDCLKVASWRSPCKAVAGPVTRRFSSITVHAVSQPARRNGRRKSTSYGGDDLAEALTRRSTTSSPADSVACPTAGLSRGGQEAPEPGRQPRFAAPGHHLALGDCCPLALPIPEYH